MPTSRVRRTPVCLAAALTCAGVTLVAAPTPAIAAPCDQEPVGAAARAVDVVFSGTVDSSRQTRRAGERARELAVEVDRIYRGTVGRDEAIVTMPQSSAPQVGEEWIFFADGEGSEFSVAECSGSRVANDRVTAQVEDVLGAGEVFVEPEPARAPLSYEPLDVGTLPPLSRMLAPGAGLTLIALLGLLVTRRRP